VEGLLATPIAGDPEALADAACRANVRASAEQLRHGSEIIERLCAEEGLLIVGARYSLETGVVDVFEGP
jgi:carbonic anhydrase